MMTKKETEALPIPEQYKNIPNIYRLACDIASSKHSDKIMKTLPLFLDDRKHHQKGDKKA